MQHNSISNQWNLTLNLDIREEYLYKYIVNDDEWVVNENEPKKQDSKGNENNHLTFMKSDNDLLNETMQSISMMFSSERLGEGSDSSWNK